MFVLKFIFEESLNISTEPKTLLDCTKVVVAEYYKDYPFLKKEAESCEKRIYQLVQKLALGISVTLTGFNSETDASLCEKVLATEQVSLTKTPFVKEVGSVLMPVSVTGCTITSKVKKVHT